jgi:hypothetical protein
MNSLRRRTEAWPVSPVVLGLCILGVVAAVIAVRVGVSEQHHRKILAVSSAAVAIEREGQATAHGLLTRAQANDLASMINRLGQRPTEGGCGETEGDDDVITFTTSSGPVVVAISKCSDVNISSHGTDWGANKYDGNGDVAQTLELDLPKLPWLQLNAH